MLDTRYWIPKRLRDRMTKRWSDGVLEWWSDGKLETCLSAVVQIAIGAKEENKKQKTRNKK